jgi:hypothetical protein
MRSVLWAALALTAATAVPTAGAQDVAPAIRVWVNHSQVTRADKVRAYIRAQSDGYVVVLHVDPSGRVRMLFPLDPGDDNFVRGGKDYEVRGRADREAFVVSESEGTGYVYAAFSKDPFQFDGLALNGHWDYRAPDFAVGDDTEADLTALVQKMVVGTFDYDVTQYDVGYQGGGAVALSIYDPYYAGHAWYGRSAFSISFGVGLGPAFWYDPWWDPWYDPWFGWPGYWAGWYGWGWPAWYSPYAFYNPFRYYAPFYGPRRYAGAYYGGYYGGGYAGRYTFKSHDDRWGLQPRAITPRQRTPTARAVLAGGGTGVLWNGDFGRRTVTNTRTSVAGHAAAIGRRLTPQGGQVGARDAAVGSTVVGPGRRTVTQSGPVRTDGSTDLGRIGPSRRAAPASTPESGSGARRSPAAPSTRPVARGLKVAPHAPEPPAPSRATPSRSTPRGLEPAGRSSAQPAAPSRQSAPRPSATPSTGRSTRSATPSLSRRTGPAPRASSPPRAAPAPRTSAPRASPPARSAPPSRGSPPSRSGGGGRRR